MPVRPPFAARGHLLLDLDLERVVTAFRAVDTDGSGTISIRQAEALCAAARVHFDARVFLRQAQRSAMRARERGFQPHLNSQLNGGRVDSYNADTVPVVVSSAAHPSPGTLVSKDKSGPRGFTTAPPPLLLTRHEVLCALFPHSTPAAVRKAATAFSQREAALAQMARDTFEDAPRATAKGASAQSAAPGGDGVATAEELEVMFRLCDLDGDGLVTLGDLTRTFPHADSGRMAALVALNSDEMHARRAADVEVARTLTVGDVLERAGVAAASLLRPPLLDPPLTLRSLRGNWSQLRPQVAARVNDATLTRIAAVAQVLKRHGVCGAVKIPWPASLSAPAPEFTEGVDMTTDCYGRRRPQIDAARLRMDTAAFARVFGAPDKTDAGTLPPPRYVRDEIPGGVTHADGLGVYQYPWDWSLAQAAAQREANDSLAAAAAEPPVVPSFGDLLSEDTRPSTASPRRPAPPTSAKRNPASSTTPRSAHRPSTAPTKRPQSAKGGPAVKKPSAAHRRPSVDAKPGALPTGSGDASKVAKDSELGITQDDGDTSSSEDEKWATKAQRHEAYLQRQFEQEGDLEQQEWTAYDEERMRRQKRMQQELRQIKSSVATPFDLKPAAASTGIPPAAEPPSSRARDTHVEVSPRGKNTGASPRRPLSSRAVVRGKVAHEDVDPRPPPRTETELEISLRRRQREQAMLVRKPRPPSAASCRPAAPTSRPLGFVRPHTARPTVRGQHYGTALPPSSEAYRGVSLDNRPAAGTTSGTAGVLRPDGTISRATVGFVKSHDRAIPQAPGSARRAAPWGYTAPGRGQEIPTIPDARYFC